MIPDAFFTPRSVAVVGVSVNLQSFGTRQLRSLIGFGYKGLLYPVSLSGGEFFGLKAYPNLRDIPGNVDLAIICVPARAVASVVQDCLAKGTLAVEVLSAGFGELDEEGRSLELELAKLSLKGVRILGPNCFGVYCPAGGLSIVPGANFSKEGGSVGLIAQSGQFAEMIAMQAKGLGIRFSKAISYGNACDVGEADLLEFLFQDPDTKVIAAYVEGIRQGRRFFEIARANAKMKPLIIWKAGLTPAGRRAASSHTGSLAGDETTWNAVVRQTGVVSVDGLDELIDTTLAFSTCSLKCGQRLALVSGGGGGTVAGADICSRWGVELPVLSRETQDRLRPLLPVVGSSVKNPVDVANPSPPIEVLKSVLDILCSSGEIDVVMLRRIFLSARGGSLAFGGTPSERAGRDELREVAVTTMERFQKPVFVVLHEEVTGADTLEFEGDRRRLRDYYLSRGIPVYPSLERAVAALARLARYHSSARR